MNKKYSLIFSRRPGNTIHWLLIVVYVIAFTLLDDYFLMLDDETSLFIMLTGLFVLHLSLNYYFLIHKVKANL